MIAAVGLVSLLLVSGLTYWLHRRLVVAPGLSGGWARAADGVLVVGGVLGVAAFLVARGTLNPSWARPLGYVGFTYLAIAYYLILGTLAIGIIALIVRAVQFCARSGSDSAEPRARSGFDVAEPRARSGSDVAEPPARSGSHTDAEPPARSLSRSEALAEGRVEGPRRWLQWATGAVVIASVAAIAYGLVEADRVRVTQHEVTIADLPPQFSGLRIALITDVHVGPARGAGFTRRLVDLTNAEHPDLVILAGDLIDGTVQTVARELDPLRDLTAPLGVFAVTGNHEYISASGGEVWMNLWQTLGVTTLRNSRVELHRDGAVIDLSGVLDKTAPSPPGPDVDAALAGRDPNRVLIHLAHQPRQAWQAQGRGVDLQLSGHTHGGQLWPFRYFVKLQQPVVSGFDVVGDVPVFTSRGAGAWGPPVRVGSPPQIALITLR